MPWGILEDRSGLDHVPGTALLEQESNGVGEHYLENLKKKEVRGETIILVPQPSDDANDPLNWPVWARDGVFLLYAYCGLLCIGGIGPILSSLTLDLVAEFGIDFNDVSLLTGYSLCATAASGIFVSAATHKYGKRIPLLVSITCAFVGTTWGGFAQSYHSLLGARIVQGFSVSMFESVFFAIVGDLYFVHERGFRIAIVTNCISGLSNLPPVLSGKIATDHGWRWVFWLLAIFLGLGLLLSIVFGWETAYNRNVAYNTDVATVNVLDTLDEKRAAFTEHDEGGSDANKLRELSAVETTTESVAIPRKSFAARLNPYSTTYSDKPFWSLCLDPIRVMPNPTVIWAILLMAFSTLWGITINLLLAQIFADEPYLLNTTQLGYLNAGPAVGGIIGSLLSGAMSDPLIKFMSRKNQGVYEPEYRLLLIVPAFILAAIGYPLFGVLAHQGRSPIIMATLWGIIIASLQFVMMAVGTYCVDAYRATSVEIFIATMVVKNFLFFGFSYILNDWIVQWGPERMFYTITGIELGLCLTTIPLYVFGKRLRAWWHKPAN